MTPEIRRAEAAVQRAQMKLGEAYRAYLAALASDDLNERVAFLLYQHAVQREDDWPENEPVTWKDWHTLQIDSERDNWRQLAAAVLAEIEAVQERGDQP